MSPACACSHADRSVRFTNIYLLINRLPKRIGRSVFKLSFTIITGK